MDALRHYIRKFMVGYFVYGIIQSIFPKAREHEIDLIDLVVVNLYPFEQTIAREGVTMEEAIEQIDIGGPSMLRSAAKNHRDVSVVCDPADYDRVLRAMESGEEELGKLRRELALKVFARTAEYDSAIAGYLNEQQGLEPDLDAISGFPKILEVSSEKALPLRYGENPISKRHCTEDFSIISNNSKERN